MQIDLRSILRLATNFLGDLFDDRDQVFSTCGKRFQSFSEYHLCTHLYQKHLVYLF